MRRAVTLLTLFIFGLALSPLPESAAEFYGDFPTGLLELERKYPYYLYVPPDYSPERSWPLVVVLGRGKSDPKEVIEPWVEWAKANQYFVLVPTIFPRDGVVPTLVDQWLLGVKQEVFDRYRIDSQKVLLVGTALASNYAAYLGLSYPEEFSATALVGGTLPGSFERLMRSSEREDKQISLYVAADPKDENFSRTESWALGLEKKGYPVTLTSVGAGESFDSLRDKMIQWFREETETRTALKGRRKKGFKNNFRDFWEDFFKV